MTHRLATIHNVTDDDRQTQCYSISATVKRDRTCTKYGRLETATDGTQLTLSLAFAIDRIWHGWTSIELRYVSKFAHYEWRKYRAGVIDHSILTDARPHPSCRDSYSTREQIQLFAYAFTK